jgi:hypothetical protein
MGEWWNLNALNNINRRRSASSLSNGRDKSFTTKSEILSLLPRSKTNLTDVLSALDNAFVLPEERVPEKTVLAYKKWGRMICLKRVDLSSTERNCLKR